MDKGRKISQFFYNNNTNKDDFYQFEPFFIQEIYTGRDNLSLLKEVYPHELTNPLMITIFN